MNKKKVIGLSILLLVLLLGLSTTSYADNYIITNDDIDLIVDHYEVTNTYKEQIKTNMYNKLRNIYNNFDTCVLVVNNMGGGGSLNGYYLYGFNSSNIVSVSNAKDPNFMSVVLTSNTRVMVTGCYIDYQGYHNSYSDTNKSGQQFGTGAQQTTRYLLVPTDLNGKFTDAPWQNQEILNFNQYYFIYAPSSLITDINLNNTYYFAETAQEILFAYNPFDDNEINEADAVIPGYIAQAENFEKAIFSVYVYNYTTGKFEYNGEHWEQTTLGNIENNIIDVTFSAYNYGTLYKPDTIVHGEFIPNTTDFENVHADFYIRSPYSVIENNTLKPDKTFSGDYLQIYNNNNNTDKIIENENENNNFWKDTYDKLFTIESGEIKDKIDKFVENTQLEDFGDLGIDEQVLGILDGEPKDFIIAWNDIYIPNLKENRPIKLVSGDQINFSKLTRENEGLNSAMSITRVIMGYTCIVLMIMNIWKTLMITLGVGVMLYEENEEEKARMETQTTEIWNISGDTPEYTRTISTWEPKTRIRTNIHYRGK